MKNGISKNRYIIIYSQLWFNLMQTRRTILGLEMNAIDGQCEQKIVFSSSVQILLSLPFFLISYINNIYVLNMQFFFNSYVYKRSAGIL